MLFVDCEGILYRTTADNTQLPGNTPKFRKAPWNHQAWTLPCICPTKRNCPEILENPIRHHKITNQTVQLLTKRNCLEIVDIIPFGTIKYYGPHTSGIWNTPAIVSAPMKLSTASLLGWLMGICREGKGVEMSNTYVNEGHHLPSLVQSSLSSRRNACSEASYWRRCPSRAL